MTETTLKIIRGAVLTFIAAVLIFFLNFFLTRKSSVFWAVFDAVCVTICVIVLIVLLILIAWRLFTKEGREMSGKYESRKRRIIRENLEAWNRENRKFIKSEERKTNRRIDRYGTLEDRDLKYMRTRRSSTGFPGGGGF